MHSHRITWAALATLLLLPPALAAQKRDTVPVSPGQQAFESRRAALVRELQETQNQLSDVRNQRIQLQARIEAAVAQNMAQRAQALLMSNEQTALQQLDAMLTSAQDNLVAQRDRMSALGDAVRRRTGAVLVVLLRADSSQAQTITAAELQIDNASAATRTYSATANAALAAGAVDQVYRASVLATGHTVQLQVTVNGSPVVQSINVNSQTESVTYVQFAVRNGQLLPTSWTSKGTTPF
ncbi:MAG: hypothetical protein ACR2OG_03085 [Gemmatimonadaceae bacterium]